MSLETHDQPSTQNSSARIPVRYDQSWLSSLLRPLLIALMVVSLNIALLICLRRIMPELAGSYLPLLTVLGVAAALIGCTTTAWLGQPIQRMRRTVGYRLAELTLLLVVTRIAVWATVGFGPTLYTLLTRPLESLLDGLYLMGALIVTFSWLFATEMSRDLLDLALQPDELRLIQTNGIAGLRDSGRPVAMDRGLLLNSFVARWVMGGVLLVLLAAASQAGLGGHGLFALSRQHLPAALVLAIIVYFLAGLLLVSQGQLALLRARWTLEQTPSAETVISHWPFYVAGVLGVVAFIAAMMPFGGTYWLSRVLSTLIGLLYLTFFVIFQIVSALFFMLLSLLPMGLRGDQAPQQPLQPQFPSQPSPSPQSLEWASGALFWLTALAILGYLAVVYFTDKGANIAWLRWLLEMVRGRWLSARYSLRRWSDGRLGPAKSVDGSARQLRRFLPRRQRLSLGGRVRFLYFTALEQAEAAGTPRRQAETPHVFAPRLQKVLAETDEATTAVVELTQAFVAVRYAHERVDSERVTRLEQLGAALARRLKRT